MGVKNLIIFLGKIDSTTMEQLIYSKEDLHNIMETIDKYNQEDINFSILAITHDIKLKISKGNNFDEIAAFLEVIEIFESYFDTIFNEEEIKKILLILINLANVHGSYVMMVETFDLFTKKNLDDFDRILILATCLLEG